MSEMDVLVAAIAGGFVSSAVVSTLILGQIKFIYEQKLRVLQMQIMALQIDAGMLVELKND